MIASVFFLNPASGWALLSTQPTTGSFTAFSPESTVDGGKTWTKTALLPVPINFLPVLTRLTYLTFFDDKHGWLELQLASSSNFKYGLMFATQDGGMTWRELPRPPIVDQMVFLSPTVGWITGGPAGDSLYRTSDDGKSWQAQTVPNPPAVTNANRPQYAPPSFSNSHDGVLAATYLGTNDEPNSAFAVFTTADGGTSWKQKRFEKTPVIGSVPSSAYDSTIIRAFTTHNSFVIGSHTITPRLASSILPGLSINGLSFVDQFNGWLQASGDTCTSGPNCKTPTRLFATKDGGQSLTDITPLGALALAESTDVQDVTPDVISTQLTAPGFDISCAPSLTTMQTWKQNSPLANVGIYLGGANTACKSNTNLYFCLAAGVGHARGGTSDGDAMRSEVAQGRHEAEELGYVGGTCFQGSKGQELAGVVAVGSLRAHRAEKASEVRIFDGVGALRDVLSKGPTILRIRADSYLL